MPQTVIPVPKLAAFLAALPHADGQAFVSPPGLGGTWRSRFIRSGLDKGVLAVHWSGAGLCIVQPSSHGVCKECASHKGNDCQHCACSMCAWFRMTEERASPRITPTQMKQLAERLKNFRLGGTPKSVGVGMLDDDLWSD
jgi:hypothetical protein